MSRLFVRSAQALAVALVAAACDGGVGPAPPPTIALSPPSPTIQVGESLQIEATVTDRSDKVTVSDLSWSSLDQGIATISPSGVVLGVRPGSTRIVAAVAGVADTATLRVARTPGQIAIDSAPAVAPGDVVQLTATVIDTDGGEMSADIDWSVSDVGVATIDDDGDLTGVTEGTVRVTAVARPVSAEIEVTVRIPPPPEECAAGAAIELGVGETRGFDGGAALSLCLSGGAEYLLVAANADDAAAVAVVEAEGVSAPLTTSTNLLFSRGARTAAHVAPRPDNDFEWRLRRREREQLAPRAARPRVTARSSQVLPTARAVGDLLELSTSADCEARDPRVGRVHFVGERSIVVADTANPEGLTPADYARFGMLYDTLLYPVVTDHFGEPAGMNGETRVVIFYTRAVNELTEGGSDGVVGGFFWAGDLFPIANCMGSNEREMFYILAADPNGTVNGNVRSVEYVERATAATIAHELQHLVNASRRIYVNDALDFEHSWLNEGLSHIAEELLFYHRSGFSARQNLGPDQVGRDQATVDIANRYAVSNVLRFDRYLRDVERQGPFQSDDDLATRGASWQFLRYAIDRHGGDSRTLLSALVDSRESGLTNLEAVFGIDARSWFVDETVALFADDWVAATADVYRLQSWNFRTLYDWINDDGFVIRTRTLRNGDGPAVPLQAWGTAYLRTAVGTGRIGNVRLGTGANPPAAALRFVLLRTR